MGPHLAASVVLLREARDGLEVCMLRRRRGASFMASACVFPGGGADPGEPLEHCAARELLEEAGVALVRDAETAAPARSSQLDELRGALASGATATAGLAAAGLRWDARALQPWSHWITPSLEPRRFSAHFFVAALPEGQDARCDAVETVEQVWVDPRTAEDRAAELALPPPQVRTLWELRALGSWADVLAAAQDRAAELRPILPRMAPLPAAVGATSGAAPFQLLLPWDPEYLSAGQGEAGVLEPRPRWAVGPSRFILEERAWRHRSAAGSTTGG
jgi:8-oxo-dGTP pyrophosphatase MutT (NUDIX family)